MIWNNGIKQLVIIKVLDRGNFTELFLHWRGNVLNSDLGLAWPGAPKYIVLILQCYKKERESEREREREKSTRQCEKLKINISWKWT